MSAGLCILLCLVAAVTAGTNSSVVDSQKNAANFASQIQALAANLSALWNKVNDLQRDGGVHLHVHDGDSPEDHDDHDHHEEDDHLHDDHHDDSDDKEHHDIHLYMHLQQEKPKKFQPNLGEMYAHCEMMPNKFLPKSLTVKHKVMGSVYISEQDVDSPVVLDVQLHGFDKSLNKSQRQLGMHIHEFGDMERCCDSLGGHLNPTGHAHGGPDSDHRHHGDLGNIEYDDEGKVNMTLTDNVIDLRGKDGLIGRSIVIHAHADDLGKGTSAASKSSGDAGAKIACCVIGRAKKREPLVVQSSTTPSSSTTTGKTQAGNSKTTSATPTTKKP